jgi:hypothetical protein
VARSQEAQSYLDRVGAALADLPEEDRADLLDELGTHVDEIAAEGTSSLEARLGSPEDYAAELRASAGLPPAGSRGGASAALRARLQRVTEHRQVVLARDFLGVLHPAWWVLRAWVVVGLVAMWPGQTTPTWADAAPFVPRVGTPGLGLLVLLAAVVASVQLGRRSLSGGAHAAVVVLNVGAALLLLPVLVSLGESTSPNYVYVDSGPREVVPPEGVYSAGTQVWNIYAYDAAGRMLHDVRLYDQEGKPLSLGLAFDPTKQQTLDAAGQKVDNAFPYRYVDPTTGDVVDPEAAPPIVAPPLLGVPVARPTPSPTNGKQ